MANSIITKYKNSTGFKLFKKLAICIAVFKIRCFILQFYQFLSKLIRPEPRYFTHTDGTFKVLDRLSCTLSLWRLYLMEGSVIGCTFSLNIFVYDFLHATSIIQPYNLNEIFCYNENFMFKPANCFVQPTHSIISY